MKERHTPNYGSKKNPQLLETLFNKLKQTNPKVSIIIYYEHIISYLIVPEHYHCQQI